MDGCEGSKKGALKFDIEINRVGPVHDAIDRPAPEKERCATQMFMVFPLVFFTSSLFAI